MKTENSIAFEKLVSARPVLIGCRRAGEVIPGFRRNLILHSGPELEFGKMRGPHRKGVVGAALYEGLARTASEAEQMIENGEIELAAANDWNSGAPGSGITSYSMAVLVVREANSGIIATAPPIEGAQGGGLGGWGVYNEEVKTNLDRIAGSYAPLLDAALAAIGGIDVVELFSAGLQMGDEEHTRQVATDNLFFSKIFNGVDQIDAASEEKFRLLRFLQSCRRFVHHVGCASAVASLKSASGVAGATLVTAMCGNGVEFGIKTSGTGEQWFTAPAPVFNGHYFSPENGPAESSPWLGDSSNVEAWGVGGMAAAAAPALLAMRGETLEQGIAQCREMARITCGVNPHFAIPTLGECAPAGILPERVVETGITPKMHGGILSRTTGGQIGIGYARTPLDCFGKALSCFGR